MSAAHTPGPWKLRTGFDTDTKEIYAPNPKIKKPFIPCQLAVVMAECKKGKANARLIASAPDLLITLQRAKTLLAELSFSDWIPKQDTASEDVRQRIKAAHVIASSTIAKATGVES